MIERRHDLCYLNPELPTENILTSSLSNSFLKEWLSQGRPLMLSRQPDNKPNGFMKLAIAFFDKITLEKHRFSYLVDKKYIIRTSPLPKLENIFPNLISHSELDIDMGVYGSYCWEHLSKMTQTTADSDLDLLITYQNQSTLDLSKAMSRLEEKLGGLKIDGEVRFMNLGDCALYELIKSQSPTIMFKNLSEVILVERKVLYELFPSLLS